MNIIIPMAGIGKRMRPHTFSTPKPLIAVAGKPIVQWLVEELFRICDKPVDELAFIIGDFGKDVEEELLNLAKSFQVKGKIYYQKEALGTAHAIYCAEPSLNNEIIIAFADTIFFADFNLNNDSDSIIWVKKVNDPSSFGVVKLNDKSEITDFIEKPKTFVSDLAIIGIYYFKNGLLLKNEIQKLLDYNIKVNNEFQLTDALQNLKNAGLIFKPGVVNEWLDCGNKTATLETNSAVLNRYYSEINYLNHSNIKNSVIHPPCYIHPSATIHNSVIGPNVSVGHQSVLSNSIIKNSMIFNESNLDGCILNHSIVGNFTKLKNYIGSCNLGDYSEI